LREYLFIGLKRDMPWFALHLPQSVTG